jgi:hypothetical protein
VVILEPPPPVPAPLEVVANRVGEEANGGKVVADLVRSGDNARWQEARVVRLGLGSSEVRAE